MSEWNWKIENIYKYISEKYDLLKPINMEKAKGKIVKDVFYTGEQTYIYFEDDTVLILASQTDWDGGLDSPIIVTEIEYKEIVDFLIYKYKDKGNTFNVWDTPIIKELEKLTKEFRKTEKEIEDEVEYKRLKRKFGDK